MKSRFRKSPRIVFLANLWTLTEHPSPRREWSLATKLRAIAAAGFDGVLARADPITKRLADRRGLRLAGHLSTSKRSELRPLLEAQRDAGAEIVNLQLGDDFTPIREASQLTFAALQEARRLGVYASIEAHRDTATETPEKLYAIADAYKRATGELLPITWDHSHLAIVKHLRPTLFSEVLLARADLIRSARSFHCRPFNGHHCQVPVYDQRGRLTSEFRQWLRFAEDLFECWMAGPRPLDELWVCPELGPRAVHGYNLSTMPPSWSQAKVCREHLAALWRRLGGVTGRAAERTGR